MTICAGIRSDKTLILICVMFCFLALLPGLAVAVDPGTDPAVQAPLSDTRAIIGGTAVTSGTPWIAALVYNSADPAAKISSRHFCGGALVASSWVVTAAHCVTNVRADSFKVFVGGTDLDGSEGELLDVSEVITNKYWQEIRYGDIAMLRLSTAAKGNPIAIATSVIDKALTNSTAQVYGWGYSSYIAPAGCAVRFLEEVANKSDFSCNTETFTSGDKPHNLMSATIRIASYADCQTRFAAYEKSINQTTVPEDYFSTDWSPFLLCGWNDTDQQTPCYGDSGGPLVTVVNGNAFLIGVVNSRLTPNCVKALDVESFARASYFDSFIYDAISRIQSYGFDSLCPRSQKLDMIYIPLGGGNVSTTAEWSKDSNASGYRLYYAVADSLGKNIAYIDLPGSQAGFSITLTSGQRFHIAVQGRGDSCDGPVSPMKEVIVP